MHPNMSERKLHDAERPRVRSLLQRLHAVANADDAEQRFPVRIYEHAPDGALLREPTRADGTPGTAPRA